MTKAGLIKALEPFEDNMQVFMSERLTEFKYGLLNSVRSQKINLMEEPDGEVLAQETVIILDEE